MYVIIVVETFLTPNNLDECYLQNYVPFHNVRDGVGGGGITIFLHKDIVQESPPEVLANIVTADLNHFITLRFNSVGICVTGTYRRPAGNKTTFIKELDEYCLSKKNNVICGDFNLDILDTNDTDVHFEDHFERVCSPQQDRCVFGYQTRVQQNSRPCNHRQA